MMRERDKAILGDLQRFRCMSRDDIIEIHFKDLKNPVSSCNHVLKRLRRDDYIEVNTETTPYTYFPSPTQVKKNGSKIQHFLAIVDFYKQLQQYDPPKIFNVEPKYGKEYMEPDVFMIWQGAPFFVEVQCSVYNQKRFNDKMKRYEMYAYSDNWKRETWQPKNKKVFPYIWIISDVTYNIESDRLKVFQSKNVEEFLVSIR